MRKTVYGAAVAACLASTLVHAADQSTASCTYRDEPLTAPVPAAGAVTTDKHRVTLLAVNPVEGTEVRASSVLELDVEYRVAGFAPDKFFLMVRFPTVALGSTSPDETPDHTYLQAASGKVHLCVPLAKIYEHPGVRWPLSFVVSINEQFADHSRVAVDSRQVQLNSAGVPTGALARQQEVPPEDVQRALMAVFGYIEQQGAMNKLCPSRFAGLRARYNKTYRAWESRNATTIRQIHEMQYELLRGTMPNPAAAAMAFDAARNAVFSFWSDRKDPELRPQCEGTMETLADETGDLAIATAVNLEIVQEYLAGKQKTAVTP